MKHPIEIHEQYQKANGATIYRVNSSSDSRKRYTVQQMKKVWSCSCKGWTCRFPRKDCVHIREGVKPQVGA